VSLTSTRIDNCYIMYHTSIVFPTVAIIHNVWHLENWRNDWTSNVFNTISQRPSHTTSHTSTRIVLGYLYVYMHKCIYLHSRCVHCTYMISICNIDPKGSILDVLILFSFVFEKLGWTSFRIAQNHFCQYNITIKIIICST